MELFFQLFDTGIPWKLFILTFLVAISASAWLFHKSRKQVLLPWIMAVLFLMLYTAVLRRTSQPEYSIHLMPFWSIQALKDGYIETLYEKIYNVIFFVPYGVLNGLGFRVLSEESVHEGRAYGLWSSLKRTVLIGFVASVSI